MPTKKKSNQARGNSAHYRKLAEKSQAGRIKRNISAEVTLDRATVCKLPGKGRPTDCGYDITAAMAEIIPAGQELEIQTGVSVACPEGYAFIIAPRYALTVRGLIARQVFVDSTYRGPLSVWLHNVSPEAVKVDVGNKIAQLVFFPQINVEFKKVAILGGGK